MYRFFSQKSNQFSEKKFDYYGNVEIVNINNIKIMYLESYPIYKRNVSDHHNYHTTVIRHDIAINNTTILPFSIDLRIESYTACVLERQYQFSLVAIRRRPRKKCDWLKCNMVSFEILRKSRTFDE